MGNSRQIRRVLAACVYLLAACGSAHADRVLMLNGDVITGDVKRIWDGELFVEPDYADEFAVDLEAIKAVEGDRDFEVRLFDGRSVVAQLGGSDEAGRQIMIIDGEEVLISLFELLELEEPEDFVDTEYRVTFNSTINKGNTDSENAKLDGYAMVKLGDHRHIVELSLAREELNGDNTKEQDRLVYNYNWLFDDPWFLSAQGSAERDPIRELDRRLITSIGVGRDLFNRPALTLNIQLGVGAQTEEIGMESDQTSIATWQLRYRQEFLGGDMELFHNNIINSNLGGRRNNVLKIATGVRFEIIEDFYTNFELDFDYETNPAEGNENADTTFLVGIGVEF